MHHQNRVGGVGMREIKFRGKRIDTEEWLFGGLVVTNDKHYGITLATKYDEKESFQKIDCIIREVIPETIGQFTGMRDKNGKEIYEGDIVKNDIDDVGLVIFSSCGEWCVDWGADDIFNFFGEVKEGLYVIGNIHDNPELLQRQ